MAEQGITLLRPSREREAKRFGEPMLKMVRQLIESVNDTLKVQLGLELHGGRSCKGVAIRIAQRVRGPAAASWFNNTTGAPVTRSLIAFDHKALRSNRLESGFAGEAQMYRAFREVAGTTPAAYRSRIRS